MAPNDRFWQAAAWMEAPADRLVRFVGDKPTREREATRSENHASLIFYKEAHNVSSRVAVVARAPVGLPSRISGPSFFPQKLSVHFPIWIAPCSPDLQRTDVLMM